MLRPVRTAVARFAAVILLGLAVSACNPDADLRVNSPATDSGGVGRAAATADIASVDDTAGETLPAATRVAEDARPEQPVAEQPVSVSFASTSNKSSKRAGREQPVSNQLYYIEFRSRSALSYGHTFAMFGRLRANGSIETREVAGLHPATESPVPWMIGHVMPVASETGPSDGDLEEQYVTSRHRLTMDKARYDEMVAYIRGLQASSPMWHAVFYNCNAFVGDIARHMGLTPPGNSMLFPKEYIDELRALNRSTRS